jgi:hypothetical protein
MAANSNIGMVVMQQQKNWWERRGYMKSLLCIGSEFRNWKPVTSAQELNGDRRQPVTTWSHEHGIWGILLETPCQLEPPINRLKRAEVLEVINSINPKKSSGYNLITGKFLKELPIIGIKYFTQLFNCFAQRVLPGILILKPGKPPNELTSYQPISLLPIHARWIQPPPFHSVSWKFTFIFPSHLYVGLPPQKDDSSKVDIFNHSWQNSGSFDILKHNNIDLVWHI